MSQARVCPGHQAGTLDDPIELFRIAMIAKNADPQYFDDPQRLSRLFGRDLTGSDRQLLPRGLPHRQSPR